MKIKGWVLRKPTIISLIILLMFIFGVSLEPTKDLVTAESNNLLDKSIRMLIKIIILLCNVGIAIVTGFIVSYNLEMDKELKEKKNILIKLEEKLNNFIRAHLNILFSSKMLNQKLNKSDSDCNVSSNIIFVKDIETAYMILKKLIEGNHSKIFRANSSDEPLRLKYMDYIYKLQKEYYLKEHEDFIEKYESIEEKMYLFSRDEKKVLRKIYNLFLKTKSTFNEIKKYEKYENLVDDIRAIKVGENRLTYQIYRSNGATICNYFCNLEEQINSLEEPLNLCKKYLGINNYAYIYNYESLLINKEEFRESLETELLQPIIEKFKIKLSDNALEKIKYSKTIQVTQNSFEYNEEQEW